MRTHIILDSGPLGLLFQKAGVAPADDCRRWARQRLADGMRLLVPEIIHYELRRELLRLGKTTALDAMSRFVRAEPDRFVRLTSRDFELAAEMWADARKRGMPTADTRALDIDMILASQVKNQAIPQADLVVATTNVRHLSQFVPAELWSSTCANSFETDRPTRARGKLRWAYPGGYKAVQVLILAYAQLRYSASER